MLVYLDLRALTTDNRTGVYHYSIALANALIRMHESDILSLRIFCRNNNITELDPKYIKVNLLTKLWSNKIFRVLRKTTCSLYLIRWIHVLFDLLPSVENWLYFRTAKVVFTPTTILNGSYFTRNFYLSIHDLQHYDRPENFSRIEKNFRDQHFMLAIKSKCKILVSSNFVRDSLLRFDSLIDPTRIFLFRECQTPSSLVVKCPIQSLIGCSYLYYPASYWVHKNHRIAIEFFLKLASQTETKLKFVLTGAGKDNLIADFSDLPVNVIHLGYVNEGEKDWLYENATIVVSFSSYEASSLPLLEALRFSSRCLFPKIPPILEEKNSFQFYCFNLTSVDDFILKSTRLLSERKHPSQIIRTWDDQVRQFLQNVAA